MGAAPGGYRRTVPGAVLVRAEGGVHTADAAASGQPEYRPQPHAARLPDPQRGGVSDETL